MMRDGRRSSRTISTMRRPLSLRDGQAARIGRGNVGAAGQRHAQRFRQAGHGGRGAHHGAVAGAARDAAFDLAPFFFGELAGAEQIEELAAVGAGAELAVAPLPAQHRSAGHHDGRNIRAGRAHQLRGRGLVAAAEQHHAIERIGADGSLPRPSPSGCDRAWRWACMNISPSEMVGNSSGKPPAAQTPRFTASATVRRCALQLFSSLQELQMPMTGLPGRHPA